MAKKIPENAKTLGICPSFSGKVGDAQFQKCPVSPPLKHVVIQHTMLHREGILGENMLIFGHCPKLLDPPSPLCVLVTQ